ncbi:phosphotransferase [Rubrobacter tropicus]|uniref:Phosphotransferase n=1 Tax=Rubrobacter tropicus TaxID=2653851 RepID=A0A6G8QEG8_9ACTN|nr:aminoglycoside phosphotransferase family protein [Rubrobacter tropicus]QIN84879.1 phosphotransferase [Rubrobacter tropicus]
MNFPPIPEDFVRTQTSLHGDAGAAWLDRLPALTGEFEERWSLSVGPPFPNLSYNWVAPALREGGTPAVLKLSFPGEKEFGTEAAALEVFAGGGICRLLELDLDRGAMLLERLEPGTPLTALRSDEEATATAAGVMKKLWRPAPAGHAFPTVADWARGFDRLRRRFGGGTGPMQARLVEEAESLFADLLASQGEPLLLHGDLHQENILKAGREPWLAIDPKGVVGEAAYDTAALLHNPAQALDTPDPKKLLERRLEVLSGELGLDRARIRAWGLAQAVLAGYWTLEDGGSVWDEALVFARLLEEIED